MCGIAGFWRSRVGPGAILEGQVRAMTAVLRHRGPDDRGAWCSPASGLALGHTRLSILDLSAAGHQPMVSADGRFVLVFNGEVYNFAELRRELQREGQGFRGASDTEVVLHALSSWGVERALRRFVGMFALAFWDDVERVLVLARDRLGIKPLYWGVLEGTLFFGSELKALRAHPAFPAILDRDALALFFRHNYVPAPHTIYRDVKKVRPGEFLRFEAPGRMLPGVFWDLRAVALRGMEDLRTMGSQEAELELERVLGRAVEDRLVSDVPLGAFLSGGLDSSTVVALMQRASSERVKTFTIGFREEAFDEARHAREVAEHLGTDHYELTVTPQDALDVIPAIPDRWDEPFADSSQIPTYLVSRFAREAVTVILSGDGGDELFGGYPRYEFTRRIDRVLRCAPVFLRRLLGSGIAGLSSAGRRRLARALPASLSSPQPGSMASRMTRVAELLQTLRKGSLYQHVVSHWKAPEELVRGSREPPTLLADPNMEKDFPGIMERMMFLDSAIYLPDDILCKVDRASMAVGLEARVPLLDHRVVEFLWSLPLEVRVGPAPGKRLLHRMLRRYVPARLFERPKMGFGIPISDWLRGPLRPWCEELLDERRLREQEILSIEPVRRRWEEHLSGGRDWGYHLWDVLVFQAWYERWEPGMCPAH